MKIPVIPLAVAATLVGGVVYLYNSANSERTVMGEPRLEKLVDLEGTETEVAVAPDGTRLVAVASGDLWLFDIAGKSRKKLTETTESESFPAWAPDGKRLTFTRGKDTFALSGSDFSSPQLFKENATSMSWSATGRLAFVRERSLWITDAAGLHERALVEADSNPEIAVQGPRFSPDSTQVAFIKTNLGFQGEVWVADATSGTTRSLVADRWAENPLDLVWLRGGKQLAYLTNRSGAYAVWLIDFAENTLNPLSKPLDGVHLDRVGMGVWEDRIFVPRHFVDSNIVVSDGTVVAQTQFPELEPAVSRDGKLVAYTLQKDNKFEIWTANADGSNALLRSLGTQPRYSPNGFEIVYTHTDIEGSINLRKLDIRDNSSQTLTDSPQVDFQADWSPDGRTIAFASNNVGGPMALWSLPAAGGKRSRLIDRGYFPRFSPDGRSLLYWSEGAMWTSDLSGANARRIREGLPTPTPATWIKGAPQTFQSPEVNSGKEILPAFDVFPDGKVVTATVRSADTALWTVTPTYVASAK